MSIGLEPVVKVNNSSFSQNWKPYPAYKDSCIIWLGEVPEHWGITRLKFSAKLNMGQSPSSEECNFEGEGTPFLQGNAEFGEQNPTPKLYCSTTRKHAQSGDFLLSVRAPVGALNLADQKYGIGRGLCAITPFVKQLESGYTWYLLSVVRNELNMVATGSTYEAVAVDQVGDIHCILPYLPEQRAIASFLDRETASIDTLISKKERLIALLKEKRAALISHAVIKGLDPDVPMKDSGMEWLGEIPAHWGETNTSALFMENKKKNKGAKEANLLSLSYGNIVRKDINSNEGLLPETFDTYQIVKPGFIVLRLTDLQNDKRSLRVGHVNEKGIITSAYVALVKKSDAVESTQYFYYLLHTYDIIKVFYGMGAGVRQSLNFNELKKLRLLLPTPIEQTAINNFINRETNKIDLLIPKIREAIEKLQEYRTALISAAVTGKIDVRKGGIK